MTEQISRVVAPQDDGALITITVEKIEPRRFWWWHNEQTKAFWNETGEPLPFQILPDPVYPDAIREIYRVFASRNDREEVLKDLRDSLERTQRAPFVQWGEEVDD